MRSDIVEYPATSANNTVAQRRSSRNVGAGGGQVGLRAVQQGLSGDQVAAGVLGGVRGLVGLFLGPIIMAALLTVWREWVMPREPKRDER